MNQEMQPWEEPLDDSYWQGLLEDAADRFSRTGGRDMGGGFRSLPQESVGERAAIPHTDAGPEGPSKDQPWLAQDRPF